MQSSTTSGFLGGRPGRARLAGPMCLLINTLDLINHLLCLRFVHIWKVFSVILSYLWTKGKYDPSTKWRLKSFQTGTGCVMPSHIDLCVGRRYRTAPGGVRQICGDITRYNQFDMLVDNPGQTSGPSHIILKKNPHHYTRYLCFRTLIFMVNNVKQVWYHIYSWWSGPSSLYDIQHRVNKSINTLFNK